jgi:hypothetical protein
MKQLIIESLAPGKLSGEIQGELCPGQLEIKRLKRDSDNI